MKRAASIVTISAVLVISGTAAAIVAGFPDVPDDHIHANGIQWASDNNLMRGYDNGNFGPEDPVTRAQLSTIFLRYDSTLDDVGAGGGAQGPQGPRGAQGPQGPQGVPGTPGSDANVTAQWGLAFSEGINIGGSIDDRHTPLPQSYMELPAGTYLFHVTGAFMIPADGAIECDQFDGADVWPQLTFWVDNPENPGIGAYDPGEGIRSPNVLMPDCTGRHASVSGEFIWELPEPGSTLPEPGPTFVGLVAFGYTSTGGTEGSGLIQAGGGIIAQPLQNVPDPNFAAFDFFGEGGPN